MKIGNRTISKWILISAAAIILVIAFIVVGGGRNSGTASAEIDAMDTVTIEQGDLLALVDTTGKVYANQSAILTWQTSGVVGNIAAVVGDVVTNGDVLATLQETSLSQVLILSQQDLRNAQDTLDDLYANTDLATAQAALDLANAQEALRDAEYTRTVQQQGNRASQATLNSAEARLILAEQELERAKGAYDRLSGRAENDPSRALALSNYGAAQSNYDSALRNWIWYTGAPSDIEQAQLDANVAIAQAQLSEAEEQWALVADGVNPEEIENTLTQIAAAQASVNQSRIIAPFDGSVTIAEPQSGDVVSPGLSAFRLDDLSQLMVDVEVSEIDINRISLDQPVLLTFDAIQDESYEGVVTAIDPVGLEVGGAVEFGVTIHILNPDGLIRPGMTAVASITVDQVENVLIVPNRSVRSVDGDRVVYRLIEDGNAIESVEISVGSSSDSYSEIISGDLYIGDVIVLNPVSNIEEMMTDSLFGGSSRERPSGFGG